MRPSKGAAANCTRVARKASTRTLSLRARTGSQAMPCSASRAPMSRAQAHGTT